MRIGVIGARLDNGGLGIQSRDFCRHIPTHKILAISLGNHKEDRGAIAGDVRIADGTITREDEDWLLRDCDVVVGFETFYSPSFPYYARAYGVNTVLQINAEWCAPDVPAALRPDLHAVPSPWLYDELPNPKVLLRVPVDTDAIKFRERTDTTMLFCYGNGEAAYDRNGWGVLKAAMKDVKSDVHVIVKSQVEVKDKLVDSRIEYVEEDACDPYAIYDRASVLLFPRRYGGLSLPLQEAMASGMAVIATDMEPQRAMLSTVVPVTMGSKSIHRNFPYADSVEGFAEAMDAVSVGWVRDESRRNREYCERELSWAVWHERYMACLEGCK